MGKKRHQKDKLYLIPSEYAESWGGYKGKKAVPFKCLPFYCCALTLLPFGPQAVATDEGFVFDKAAVLSWLSRFKSNPVNGKPLSRKDLWPIHFHKNAQGEFHCPVTFKVFNSNSHIVCNKKSGHVYSKEAIDEICRKGHNWNDLITAQPFTPKDLVVIQDPHSIQSRLIENFTFVKEDVDVSQDMIAAGQGEASNSTLSSVPHATALIKQVLKEADVTGEEKKRKHETLMGNDYASSEESEKEEEKKKPKLKSSLFTTSGQAASLTSTVVTKTTNREFRDLTDVEDRQQLYAIVKKRKWKSYVKIKTNFGNLNVELRSDLVPETCHNFVLLCKRGKYDDTIFHRLIPHFMVQGGDPEGTGSGGKCAFKGMVEFRDEFHQQLRHDKRGVLSMANSGVDTNKSQFFILFKPSVHLDDMHSVFGHIVGGLGLLDKIERIPCDSKNKPLRTFKIVGTEIYKDAFADAEKVRSGQEVDDATMEATKMGAESSLFGYGTNSIL